MLLKGYVKEISRPACNPRFQSVHCIAHLQDDIRVVLPYLHAQLGGTEYIREPPSVTFKVHGKLISVYADRIALNALRDETEADKILEWLRREINDIWQRRDTIKPSIASVRKPQILEILKRLPKTNCGKCGQKTCMVFATLIVEAIKGPEDCPLIDGGDKKALREYLRPFHLDP